MLEAEGRPGTLHSMAAPPPPPSEWRPPEHPFLHGVSRDPLHEHALRLLLLASADFDDFLARVVAGGYDVSSGREPAWQLRPPALRARRGDEVVAAVWPGGGQFSCLWWQPAGDADVFEHVLVTAYEREAASALYTSASRARSAQGFAAALVAAGFSV